MKKGGRRKYLLPIIMIGLVAYLWGFSRLSGNYRFNVFKYDNNDVEIITGEPGSNNLTILKFPGQVWISTMDQRGEWRLDKLPELAKKFGKNWVDRSIGEQLSSGLAINYNDLSWGDKLKLYYWRLNVASRVETASESGWLEKKVAPDGVETDFLSKKWFHDRGNLFVDKQLATEEIYVVVENDSEIAGLGTYAAEIMDNVGIHVFDVSKGEGEIEKCEVAYAPQNNKRLTIEWLKQRFGCVVKISPEAKQIILRLGKEWGNSVKGFL